MFQRGRYTPESGNRAPSPHVIQQTTVTHTTTVYSSPPHGQAAAAALSSKKGGLPIGNLLQQQKAMAKRPAQESTSGERGAKSARMIEGQGGARGALVHSPRGGGRQAGGGGGSSEMHIANALRGSHPGQQQGRQLPRSPAPPLCYPIQLVLPVPKSYVPVPTQDSPRDAISPLSNSPGSSARRSIFDPPPQPTFSTASSISFSSPRSHSPFAYDDQFQNDEGRYSPVLDDGDGYQQQQQPGGAYADEDEEEYPDDDGGSYGGRGQQMMQDGDDQGEYYSDEEEERRGGMPDDSAGKIEELEDEVTPVERGDDRGLSGRIEDELHYDAQPSSDDQASVSQPHKTSSAPTNPPSARRSSSSSHPSVEQQHPRSLSPPAPPPLHPLLQTINLDRYAERVKKIVATYDRDMTNEEWENAGDDIFDRISALLNKAASEALRPRSKSTSRRSKTETICSGISGSIS